MTARPIRYQRQVSDRNGKIFYTSIASLSHISKPLDNETWEGILAIFVKNYHFSLYKKGGFRHPIVNILYSTENLQCAYS